VQTALSSTRFFFIIAPSRIAGSRTNSAASARDRPPSFWTARRKRPCRACTARVIWRVRRISP
jgi:hypothetical protein